MPHGVLQEEQRLAQLKYLREKVEAEIKAIEAGIRLRRKRRTQTVPAADVRPNVIRAWLVAQGHQMGDRGRICHELRQKYEDAHR